MKRMLSRALPFLLAALMIICLLPAPVLAVEEAPSLTVGEESSVTARGTCGSGLSWVLDGDGTLTVTGSGAMGGTAAPEDMPWAEHSGRITSVVLSSGVTDIAAGAFLSCSGLSSITIPESVRHIGPWAFSFCSALAEITIPEGVTGIGDHAFYQCSALTELVLPASLADIGEGAFSDCPRLESIEVSAASQSFSSADGVLYSRDGTALLCCPAGKKGALSVPAGVFSVGDSAFSSCRDLTDIRLPEGLLTVGSDAFFDCASLTEMKLPGSVTSIGSSAFFDCTALQKITIPDSLISIGDRAFYHCVSLKELEIPGGVSVIDAQAFAECGSLSSAVLRGGITSVGESAFRDCGSLTTVFLPASVTAVGKNAFSGCTGLRQIDFGGTKTQWQALVQSAEEGNAVLQSPELTVRCESTEPDPPVPAEIRSYTIQFDKNSGSAKGAMDTVTADSGLTALPGCKFTISGKYFDGWNTKADGSGTAYSDLTPIARLVRSDGETVTLYAQWRESRYTAVFKLDGSEVGRKNLLRSEEYTLGSFGQTKTGYHIEWTYSSKTYAEGKTVSKLSSKENGTVTLTGKWVINKYTVVFHAENGSGKTKSQSFKYNAKAAALASNGFTRTGYTFDGWEDAHGNLYANKQKVQNLTPEYNGTFDLFARWKENTYSLTVDPKGGSEVTPAAVTLRYTEEYILPAAPERTGYTFTGWQIKNGSSVIKINKVSLFPAGTAVSGLTSSNGKKLTLAAQWTPTVYSINYDTDGGTLAKGSPVSYKYTAAKALKKPTRTGYTFAGWLRDGSLLPVKSGTYSIPKYSTGDALLTAQWVPIRYQIKLMPNGGALSPAAEQTLTAEYDLPCALPSAADIERFGYTFAGWNTKADGTGTLYTASALNVTAKKGATVKLYAQWEYTVTFRDSCGGAMDTEKTFVYKQPTRLTDNGMVRPGYSFSGWSKTEGGKVKWKAGAKVTDPPTELWAVWKPVS